MQAYEHTYRTVPDRFIIRRVSKMCTIVVVSTSSNFHRLW